MSSGCHLTVGVLVRNQLPFAAACLRALAIRRAETTEVLIIDDASEPETRSFLREFSSNERCIHYLRNDRQRGFPYGCNEVIYNSSAPYICVLNSDTLVAQGWESRLLEPLHRDEHVGLTGPSTSFAHTRQALLGLKATRMTQTEDTVDAIGRRISKRYGGQRREMSKLGGFCLFFRRTLTATIGYFDEQFGLGAGEEDDFVRRARAAGYRAIWVKDAYVHHFGHRTFGHEVPDSSKLWTKNRLIYDIKALDSSWGERVHSPVHLVAGVPEN
jgi:GT2 family glycosyltransferase